MTALADALASVEDAARRLEEHGGHLIPADKRHVDRVLDVARTQAFVAIAAGLDRLANIAERIAVCVEADAE